MSELLNKILENKDFYDIENGEKLDLTKKEDVEKFHEKIDELRNNEIFKTWLNIFGYDFEDELDELDQFADETYAKSQENKKKEAKIERPSTKLSTEQGLQVHKLVQEYVDTMIRPYSKGRLTNDQINDAYAGLYEFAAWILNKK